MCDLFSWIEVPKAASKFANIRHRRDVYFLDDTLAQKFAYDNMIDLEDAVGHGAIEETFEPSQKNKHVENFACVPEEMALAINEGRLDHMIEAGFVGLPPMIRKNTTLPVRFKKDSRGRWINTQVDKYRKTRTWVVDHTVVKEGDHVILKSGQATWSSHMQQYVDKEAVVVLLDDIDKTRRLFVVALVEDIEANPGVPLEELLCGRDERHGNHEGGWVWQIEGFPLVERDGKRLENRKIEVKHTSTSLLDSQYLLKIPKRPF